MGRAACQLVALLHCVAKTTIRCVHSMEGIKMKVSSATQVYYSMICRAGFREQACNAIPYDLPRMPRRLQSAGDVIVSRIHNR